MKESEAVRIAMLIGKTTPRIARDMLSTLVRDLPDEVIQFLLDELAKLYEENERQKSESNLEG